MHANTRFAAYMPSPSETVELLLLLFAIREGAKPIEFFPAKDSVPVHQVSGEVMEAYWTLVESGFADPEAPGLSVEMSESSVEWIRDETRRRIRESRTPPSLAEMAEFLLAKRLVH